MYNRDNNISLNTFGEHENRTDCYLTANCCGRTIINTNFVSNRPSGVVDFYLQYIVKGSINFRINNKQMQVSEGNVILHYPNTPLKYEFNPINNQNIIYYWVHFTGYGVKEILKTCNIENQRPIFVDNNKELLLAFEMIYNNLICKKSLYELTTSMHIISLLTTIASYTVCSMKTEENIDERIYDILIYINQNYNKPLDSNTLAQKLNLSYSHFRKLFIEITGCPPNAYITNIRLNHAVQYLNNTALTITEIANLVGYNDIAYFSRVFKNSFTVSPKQFKNKKGEPHM